MMTFNAFLSRRAAAVVVLVFLADMATAAPPVEVPAGNLLIVRSASAERWYVMAHNERERSVLVITVSQDGDVAVDTIPLPDAAGDQDPDDPDDPDDPPPLPDGLTALVKQWADEVNDPTGRMKLAAAYRATVLIIDGGQINSTETLVALQRAANNLVLGGSASKWAGFFSRLAAYLDANKPADLAGYKAAWLEISAGLKE